MTLRAVVSTHAWPAHVKVGDDEYRVEPESSQTFVVPDGATFTAVQLEPEQPAAPTEEAEAPKIPLKAKAPHSAPEAPAS